MTTNQDRAAEVVGEAYQQAIESSVPSAWRGIIAQALADAGLLAPEETPEPAQPRPEDVPDPRPGEAWLVNYKGTLREALYWYSPIYAHWALVPNREGLTTIESHEATPIHRLVPEVKA